MIPSGETQYSSDRLALLYRLSQTFNSTLDLDQVLELVMDEVIAITGAERGFLMLKNTNGELTFRAARGINRKDIDDPQYQVSRGVIDKVAHEGLPLLTSNAQNDHFLGSRQSVMILGLRSVLCVPLTHKDEQNGLIYVDNRIQSGIFSQADLELLSSVASSAAVAIENARLYQLAVEKGRMERELQLARDVQASLLPSVLPQYPGWDFAAGWQPARVVAGDYYDFVKNEDGRLCIAIGDVTDKGMPAALYMALTRSVVRACLIANIPASEIIKRVNRLICTENTYGMFISLFFGLIDTQTGELTYVNAGHNPPLLLRKSDQSIQRLTRTGMVLGIEENHEYENKNVVMEPGDILLAYTDGVTEAEDAFNQPFGEERLHDFLDRSSRLSAMEIVDQLKSTVDEYQSCDIPSDDITLLVAIRSSKGTRTFRPGEND